MAVINNSVKTGKFTLLVTELIARTAILKKKWWPKHYKNPVLPTCCFGKNVAKHQNYTFQTSTTLSSDVTLRTVVK